MLQNSDIVYSAVQHIDRLMRRVMLPMFGAGALSVLALRRYPKVLAWVRWIGFLSIADLRPTDLGNQTHLPGALLDNYGALTLWNIRARRA